MSTINKVEKDGVVYDIGGGKGGLSRFISFSEKFSDFSWTGEEGDYVSIVGQIKHSRYKYRIKNHTHGIRNTLNKCKRSNDSPNFSDQYFETHSRNSFSLFNNNEPYEDESYKLNIPSDIQEPYQYIDYIMSYILKSNNFTAYTPAQFIPVFHCWGSQEVISYVTLRMPKEMQGDDVRRNLYSGQYDSWIGWGDVPGRFYMEPVDEQDIESNAMVNVFDLDTVAFENDKNDFDSSNSKRVSIKFIKNLHFDSEHSPYHWRGEMNFAGLFIRARFQKINDQWYTICYVCPEIVEKSKY